MDTDETVVLSIIITPVGGVVPLRRCLERLAPQISNGHVEVIVPYDSTAAAIAQLRDAFPNVVFTDMGTIETGARPGTQNAVHEIFDRRTARGLALAQGRIIALLQDRGVPAQDWCQQIIAAHDMPHGVIGGAVEHEGQSVLGWAVYFLDFGRYQLPLREGPAKYLTDVNVSYKRCYWESVRPLWADRYKEVTVNWALAKEHVGLWLRPQAIVYQDRGKLSPTYLAVERYAWGRLFGSIRVAEMSFLRRLIYVLGSPAIAAVLVARQARKVFRDRRNRSVFIKCLPYFLALAMIWSFGEFVGYLTGRES